MGERINKLHAVEFDIEIPNPKIDVDTPLLTAKHVIRKTLADGPFVYNQWEPGYWMCVDVEGGYSFDVANDDGTIVVYYSKDCFGAGIESALKEQFSKLGNTEYSIRKVEQDVGVVSEISDEESGDTDE